MNKNYLSIKKMGLSVLSLLFSLNLNLYAYSQNNDTNEKEIVVKGCEPFEYINSKENAVLLLHGLGGCPHEVSLIGEYLSKKGFTVVAPRYPGHGSKGKFMSKYGWQDWYKVAEEDYLNLNKEYKNVYVLGFSTGGTLALKLAEKYDVKKVVLLSPFIYITYKWYYILRPELYLKTIGLAIDDLPSNFTLVHLNDPQARKKYVRGDYFSFKATRSALELIDDVKENIKKVKSPLLTIHSKGDETTDYSSSEFIYNNISSKDKNFITLTKSNHIIGLDYEKDIVFKDVEEFLNK